MFSSRQMAKTFHLALTGVGVTLMLLLLATEPVNGQNMPGLVSIGTFQNKTFYRTIDHNFSTSWNGARDVCSYWNRDMAILTDDEFNYLRTIVEMSATLWLGASMRTDEINSWDFRPAFKNWDGSDFTTKNLVFRGEHMVCLYFAADDHVFSDFCNGQRGVLCQH